MVRTRSTVQSRPSAPYMINLQGLETNVILAPYTTYKIGGPADFFFVAKNKNDLVSAVMEARKNNIEYFILGTGANILIGDKGFRGLVIKNEADGVSFIDNPAGDTSDNSLGIFLTAESGITIQKLIELTLDQGLSGIEHFAGIPSTVGGAVWQNLHFLSPDRSKTMYIGDIIVGAEILDEDGGIVKVDRDFFDFDYDHSVLHERKLLVTEVTFTLTAKEKDLIQNQINENLKWRNEKQPDYLEFPSCGSVFKKIADVGAGRLIDEVGLKGHKIGGAEISIKHANFIINTGGAYGAGSATAKDICDLIKLAQDKVFAKTGHQLNTEIGMIGDF